MYISEKWLKEIVDVTNVSGQSIADQMSITGIEIEGVTNYGEKLKKIVVGQTLDVVPHPDSDHLHICQVDVGHAHENNVLQIVCGAPNVAPHQKVIVALPGARIVDNVKIKKGKIRGVESYGMLCSLEELGLPTNVIPKAYANGIFILPQDAPVGSDVVEYMQLDDAILELSITPNRSDALSMYGTAYEVGAIYEQVPHFEQLQAPIDTTDNVSNYIQSVTIEQNTNAKAYFMSIIKDVTIQESPMWLQSRLMKIGVRPVNNVVDVTNYCLMLYGQPLHAFDYGTLTDKNITVRLANNNETLQTLDEQERTLTEQDVVIANGATPVALAGVMGGFDTEITTKTKTVALEVALFDAATVRHTSKRLNLRSESSTRFEKGTHIHLMEQVVQHASAMIAQLGNGTVVSGVQKSDDRHIENAVVCVTLKKINDRLGTQLTLEQVYTILVTRLGFEMMDANGNVIDNVSNLQQIDATQPFSISVPPRRFDIRIEEDIVEEVARIYGYNNLPSTLPTTPSIQGGLSKKHAFLRQTRHLLQSLGYTQTIGYSLTSKEKASLLSLYTNDGIQLAMPMSEERSQLRLSLLTTLLDTASYNVARNNTDLALYETGRVFLRTPSSAQGEEIEHVALLLTGNRQQTTWLNKGESVDFFDVKGTLDTYFKKMGVQSKITYEATVKDNLHPGQTANILFDGNVIGVVAQLHPVLAKQYDLGKVFVAEFNVTPLVDMVKLPLVQQTVPKYPQMTRDIALLVNKTVTHQTIERVIVANGGHYLTAVTLFDKYEGSGIESHQQSLAYRLTFLNLEATLTEEEINATMATIIQALNTTCQAIIR